MHEVENDKSVGNSAVCFDHLPVGCQETSGSGVGEQASEEEVLVDLSELLGFDDILDKHAVGQEFDNKNASSDVTGSRISTETCLLHLPATCDDLFDNQSLSSARPFTSAADTPNYQLPEVVSGSADSSSRRSFSYWLSPTVTLESMAMNTFLKSLIVQSAVTPVPSVQQTELCRISLPAISASTNSASDLTSSLPVQVDMAQGYVAPVLQQSSAAHRLHLDDTGPLDHPLSVASATLTCSTVPTTCRSVSSPLGQITGTLSDLSLAHSHYPLLREALTETSLCSGGQEPAVQVPLLLLAFC